mmetsp:Transcript_6043/g.14947  ORF Transcript_6043/g.14947 Transcript_6043/m.14947 type:complete len:1125 (+) Transcript_6043:393-3767(+)|eukprot:CAMPEP_0178988370 /NCGR_PEP_ID=MMETSP0795-20121207/3774_1 /TAXON_ID=88552 /ORGANISM="Amoebophrya sp., Strain Ameob2" /LENGTH=1124 /DNA_ID=CAMNT_0020679639 /DNA_START=386 /DNA_END=3760 /DNA_ORIENTATION=+
MALLQDDSDDVNGRETKVRFSAEDDEEARRTAKPSFFDNLRQNFGNGGRRGEGETDGRSASTADDDLDRAESYSSAASAQADNVRSRRRQMESWNAGRAANKLAFTPWDAFSTVSFRRELTKDVMRKNEFEASSAGKLERFWFEASSWVIPGFGGLMGAASASFIEIMVEKIFTWRNGYCQDNFFATDKTCCGHEVEVTFECKPLKAETVNADGTTSISAAPRGKLIKWSDALWGEDVAAVNFLILALSGIVMTVLTAVLVKNFAPAARGSGIPEIKTILGGFHVPAVLEGRTLFIKCIGLCLVVSSGMCLGKEGPLVHVSCCWAMLSSRLLPGRLNESHAKVQELLSAGAAAGVSVAFGAPLGGVLFSFEEVSTFFPSRTCSRAFFAAVCAALSLQYFDPTGTGKLTMFQVTDSGGIHFVEYIPFALLGVMGGVLGAFFVRVNGGLCAARASDWWKSMVPIELEVTCIATFTVLLNSLSVYLTPLATSVIHRLFAPCRDYFQMNAHIEGLQDELNLCSVEDQSPLFSSTMMLSLAVACIYRFLQMTVTFGTGIPAGLFVPSLFCGACIGRMLGTALWYANKSLNPDHVFIDPGVYAMIGAAAMLGGVCRVTISLVVIMFELTGALEHIVPFMLAVQIARWVGDLFGDGIYDCHIRLRKYPYLHEPEDHIVPGNAESIMDDDIDCICVEDPNTVGAMEDMLEVFPHYNGFPLVRSEFGEMDTDNWILLGYVHAGELRELVNNARGMTHKGEAIDDDTPVHFEAAKEGQERSGLDFSSMIDDTIIRIVPETPLFLVHQIFHKLGLRFVAVVRAGRFKGLITKKAFVRHMQELEHTAAENKIGDTFAALGHQVMGEEEEGIKAEDHHGVADHAENVTADSQQMPMKHHKTFDDDPVEWGNSPAARSKQLEEAMKDIHAAVHEHQHLHHHGVHHGRHSTSTGSSPSPGAVIISSSAAAAADDGASGTATGSPAKKLGGLGILKNKGGALNKLRESVRAVQGAIRIADQGSIQLSAAKRRPSLKVPDSVIQKRRSSSGRVGISERKFERRNLAARKTAKQETSQETLAQLRAIRGEGSSGDLQVTESQDPRMSTENTVMGRKIAAAASLVNQLREPLLQDSQQPRRTT